MCDKFRDWESRHVLRWTEWIFLEDTRLCWDYNYSLSLLVLGLVLSDAEYYQPSIIDLGWNLNMYLYHDIFIHLVSRTGARWIIVVTIYECWTHHKSNTMEHCALLEHWFLLSWKLSFANGTLTYIYTRAGFSLHFLVSVRLKIVLHIFGISCSAPPRII